MQSALGETQGTGRADINNFGALSLAKVIKVYNENNRADVVLKTNNFLGDDDTTNGKVTCIQLEAFGGWDNHLKSYYGTVTPLVEGQIVVIAYMNSAKAQAVIIKTFPPHINEYNLFPRKRAEKIGAPQEKQELIQVGHDESYSYQNGYGEFEKVSSSRAFFVGQKRKMSDQRDTEFNWENLTLKHKFKKKTISLKPSDFDFQPFNYLGITKNQFEDAGATFNRFYHDAEKGITRFTKDNNSRVFYTQLAEDFSFEIRSNLDTNRRDFEAPATGDETLRKSDADIWNSPKENSLGPKTKDYAKIFIEKNGTIYIQRENKYKNNDSWIRLKDDEIKIFQKKAGITSEIVLSGGHIDITADEHIQLTAPRIDLN